jgi:ribonuclease P protein component
VFSDDEANFPAQYTPPEAQTRLSRQDEDACWQEHLEESARQGSRSLVRLDLPTPMRSPRSLSAKSHFRTVFKEGRRARSDGVTVWALAAHGRAETRLGLAVGTGTGGAVVRNRIRRRLRALVRALPLGGVDLIVRADGRAAELSFQELGEHLVAALAAVGLRLP